MLILKNKKVVSLQLTKKTLLFFVISESVKLPTVIHEERQATTEEIHVKVSFSKTKPCGLCERECNTSPAFFSMNGFRSFCWIISSPACSCVPFGVHHGPFSTISCLELKVEMFIPTQSLVRSEAPELLLLGHFSCLFTLPGFCLLCCF